MGSLDVDSVDWSRSQGAEAAEELSRTASFNRNDFITQLIPNPNDTVWIRMLSDKTDTPSGLEPWLTVLQHNSMKTRKTPPPDWPKDKRDSWFKSWSCICRRDPLFKAHFKGECWACENGVDADGKASVAKPRVWAIAVVREVDRTETIEIRGGRKKKVDILRNKMVEIDKDGEKIQVPQIVLLNMSNFNFFGKISSMAARWDTLLDRDLLVKKVKTGNDARNIDYQISPTDPDTVADEHEDKPWEDPDFYDYSMAEVLKRDFPDLSVIPSVRNLVVERLEDAHMQRFFWPPKSTADEGGPDAPDNDEPDDEDAPETEEEEQQDKDTADLVGKLAAQQERRRARKPRRYDDED